MSLFYEILNHLKEVNDYDLLPKLLEDLPVELREELKEHFKYNCADWINLCAWMYDQESPRGDRLRKFRLFPEQDKLLIQPFGQLAMQAKVSPDVYAFKKSRRVGWSDTHLVFFFWVAQYWGHSSVVAAQDEDTTDGSSAQFSLMPRLDIIYSNLPDWLKPDNWSSTHMSREIGHGVIQGKAVGSKQSAKKAGRGGRGLFALLDEAGFWPTLDLETAYTALSFTCKITSLVSSAPESRNHYFEQLYRREVASHAKSFFVPYTVNPANDQEWLDAQMRKLKPSKLRQEVFGEPGGTSANIIEECLNEVFYDTSNVLQPVRWSFQSPVIKNLLSNYKWILVNHWDGGGASRHNACVPSLYSKDLERFIFLKAFANSKDGGVLTEVIRQSNNWLNNFTTQYYPEGLKIKDFGDPALAPNRSTFELETGRTINLLDNLRNPSEYLTKEKQQAYKDKWARRLDHRANEVNNAVMRRCADSLPCVLVLDTCDGLLDGWLNKEWQYDISKTGEINTSQVYQNHPVGDICDAVSYGILGTWPDPPKVKNTNGTIEKLRILG